MLRQVLQEIKAARGPVDLNQLAHKLNLERDALDGMIDFWVRKGKIEDMRQAETLECFSQVCGSCHSIGCAYK
jgi:hypothetical protein